ncbi:entericidin A/B family lipoprotein [Nissabacter sp. SGAir0207]|nr:entericidin A/B family lipoprotein [Nissabacter sp. SGAir0207]QCR34888.1 entericidin [Nissabacter sp. SGAir0207]
MLNKIQRLALFLLMLTALTGCNTARGMGEDIQHLGSAISHIAS